MPSARSLTLALIAAFLVSCAAPIPSHLGRLWPRGRSGLPILGIAVNGGKGGGELLVLSRPHFQVGDRFEIQFPVGNSVVVDVGEIDRINDDLTIVRPLTARLSPARLASSLPEPDEQLYLALRDDRDGPRMVEVERWRGGMNGDWIVVPGEDSRDTARLWAGTGLYLKRKSRWRLAGLLAGVTAELPDDPSQGVALGFINLLEIARILPEEAEYFEAEPRPLRPDFEHGMPLQPGDLKLPPEMVPETTGPVVADPPAAEDPG